MMPPMDAMRSPKKTGRPSVAERRSELTGLPDEELCARCVAGDNLAWDVLVNRYQRLVYAVPFRAGARGEEAEEIFHATFVKLAERLATIRDRGRVRAWIVTTARRLTIDWIRSRRTRVPVEDSEAVLDQLPDSAGLADDVLVDLEARHEVRQAVAQLDPRCRQIIHLLFYEISDPPRSYESIAAELGMPVGSLGPTRLRCLKKLLATLGAGELRP